MRFYCLTFDLLVNMKIICKNKDNILVDPSKMSNFAASIRNILSLTKETSWIQRTYLKTAFGAKQST